VKNLYSFTRQMCDTFPISNDLKQVVSLLPLLFRFALDYAIIWVKIK